MPQLLGERFCRHSICTNVNVSSKELASCSNVPLHVRILAVTSDPDLHKLAPWSQPVSSF